MRGHFRYRGDESAQQVHDGGGSGRHVRRAGSRLKRADLRGEPVAVEGETDHLLQARFIKRERRALKTVGNDLFPDCGRAVLALAQDLRVVDLPQLDMPSGDSGPCPCDSAFFPHRFR